MHKSGQKEEPEEKSYQEALLNLAAGLINASSDKFDQAINDMLKETGLFANIDRVYVFRHDHSRMVTSNTHEWCAEGVKSGLKDSQNIPFELIKDILEIGKKDQIINIPDIAETPAAPAFGQILKNQNVQSLLITPMIYEGQNIGSIGFDSVRKKRTFTENETALIIILSKILTNAFARRHAEDSLRESEERFKAIFDGSRDAIFLTMQDAKFAYVNKAACALTGYSRDELLAMRIPDLHMPEDREAFNEYFHKIMGGLSVTSEAYVLRKDGSRISVEFSNASVMIGNAFYMHTTARDITSRKQAEEALKASEEKYRVLIENMEEGTGIADEDETFLYANPAAAKIFGVPRGQLEGRNLREFVSEATLKKFQGQTERRKKGESSKYQAEIIRLKDKEKRTLLVRANPQYNERNVFIGTHAVFVDITEKVKSDKIQTTVFKIAESANTSENLQELYNSIHKLIGFLMPAHNFFIALYDAQSDLLYFEYHVDEYEKQPPPINKTEGLTGYVFRTGKTLLSTSQIAMEFEKSGMAAEIGKKAVSWLGVPLQTGNQIIGVLVVQSYEESVKYSENDKDILEFVSAQVAFAINRKRAEERIKNQLKEKEILLKEVHHRIKNNITSIRSFLNLQSLKISNIEAKGIINDAIGRVESMGKVYEKLLLTSDYREISAKFYLEDLVKSVIHIFPDNRKIDVKCDIEDIHLGVKYLFPVGAIVNELVTNSMKYAFTNRDYGNIYVSLLKNNKKIILSVQDDGIGLPEGFNLNESSGFGFRLVKVFTEQLTGTFRSKSIDGTHIEIVFEV